MEKRRLGRTGHMSTVVIMGTAAFWDESQETANAALDLARAHGINHIDVAPQYGLAEERVGRWLPPHRDEFFLGCKTLERDAEAAWAQLHESLEKLHTDALDLYQLHAVTDMEQLEMALAPGGAIEALVQARDEGLTRYLGITGHGHESPATFSAALERFDFDTVMFPLNPVLYANEAYRHDAEQLLATCRERDVGVQIIKAIAKQPWGEREHSFTTWYEPHDDQFAIDMGVWFALSQPGVTGLPSAGDTRLLPKVIDAAERFQPLPDVEQVVLIEEAAAEDTIF